MIANSVMNSPDEESINKLTIFLIGCVRCYLRFRFFDVRVGV